MKKRILTGLKPTGDLHIGNYFGSIKPFLDLYNEHSTNSDFFLMVADYHALISMRDSAELRSSTYELVKNYMAAGVDPKKITLFRQSDNQDHTELGWILNCLVTVPFLMQAHAYKDKIAKGQEANVGLFTYPMLMAADILLYDTDIVPVGEDQRQHIEYAREAVNKFNLSYGNHLKEPQELIVKSVGVVPGLDGQKMSKSYKNTIPLFAASEEVEKAVMKIVTDSDGSFPQNVFAIHCLIKPEAELRPIYEASAGRYGDLKKQLAADLNEYLEPMRAKRARITDAEVQAVLADGAIRAKAVSGPVLARVRQAIGISL